MITLFLRCHLFMEPIAVACRRHLPSLHPLWKLLAPHIKGVIAINTIGRERLIFAGGVADNTLSVGGGGMNVFSFYTLLFLLLPSFTKYIFLSINIGVVISLAFVLRQNGPLVLKLDTPISD